MNDLTGIKESDTGLAPPAVWDLAADKQTLQNEQPLQVIICYKKTNIIYLTNFASFCNTYLQLYFL